MKYRLVALDLDGTLLDSQLLIRRGTIDALRQVRAKGVQVMIVTGRHHGAAYPYWHQLELDLPVICCNGTYMYDFRSGRPVASNPFSRREATRLLELIRSSGIYTMIYADDFMAYELDSPHVGKLLEWSATLPQDVRPRIDRVGSFERMLDDSETVWKFATAGDDVANMNAFAEEVGKELGLSCEWSAHNRLDISHAGNSKGKRLDQWIAEQGIAREEVIAFGDQQNDVEMLCLAGMGVAMGNSRAEVRECADWVAGSNDSDAIADTLQRFVLTGR